MWVKFSPWVGDFLLETKKDAIILFHDFWDRPFYHVVKQYVEIIDRVDSMLVCKRNPQISKDTLKEEYERYKYDYN